MAITGQGSAPYLPPDVSQQTTPRLLGSVRRSKAYSDQYRTYRPTPNNKPRPGHSATYNGQYRTTISTVPVSHRPTATVVLTTRLGAMTITVNGSVPYLSLGAKQPITSRLPEFVPANHVLTTRFRTMAIAVQRSVSYPSSDAQQRTKSRPCGFVQ